MDTEMMTTFLKLKEKVGRTLSNKEALRRMLNVMAKNEKPQPQAKIPKKIPGERHEATEGSGVPITKIINRTEKLIQQKTKITRYISIIQKRLILSQTNGLCSHENCHNPARIFHHQERFSISRSHTSVIPLCKIHHEFAHNGITETLAEADNLYRKYRQVALL